jgi:hypothetical protein
MSNNLWRVVFLASAMFNGAVGVGMTIDMSQYAIPAGLEAARYDPLYSPVLGWFILLFGFLYLAVWRDLDNRAIVFVGMIGKLGAAALMWLAWARGLAPLSMATLTIVDIFFALLFAAFLLTRRPAGVGS